MTPAPPLFRQDISIWQGYNKLHQPVWNPYGKGKYRIMRFQQQSTNGKLSPFVPFWSVCKSEMSICPSNSTSLAAVTARVKIDPCRWQGWNNVGWTVWDWMVAVAYQDLQDTPGKGQAKSEFSLAHQTYQWQNYSVANTAGPMREKEKWWVKTMGFL